MPRTPRALVRLAFVRLALVPALVMASVGLGTAAPPDARAAAAAPDGAPGCPTSAGAVVPRAKATGDVLFRGGGWGHGLGMSQYGAQGAARLGCDAAEILTRYYTGTSVARRDMPASISLRMLSAGTRADVVAESGDVAWELAGCTLDCPPVQPRGSSWTLRLDGTSTQYVLWDAGAEPEAVVWQGGTPAQALVLRHAGRVVRLTTWSGSSVSLVRRLRWDHTRFDIQTPGAGDARLDAVQVIEGDAAASAMDKYLWGVAEVPASFPAEALKAQAIAARTYAAKRAGRVLMPTPADQNYTGYAKESEGTGGVWGAAWKAAVDATSGQVLVARSDGSLIDALYSSSMGGRTEDERYVWGRDVPFLRPVDDSRWDLASANPAEKRSWAKAFSWATLAGRLGFQSVSKISVPRRGASGRVAGVKVTGRRAGAVVTTYLRGWDVRQTLGLLSPGFDIAVRHIGGATGTPIVGDWDGDGADEIGWYRAGFVALRMTDSSGTWVRHYRFGRSGDVPVVGDWDGDGTDTVGVFRSGTWLLRNAASAGAPDVTVVYGAAGDRPVVGRWRKGSLGIGVVRQGRWLLRTTVSAGDPDVAFRYGTARDVPAAGDWDGNGTTTVGVRRGNRWLLRDRATGGPATRRFRYGLTPDRPVPGDWDGNGTSSAGVVHARTFYLRNTSGSGRPTAALHFAG